jgi:hypothetical protein
MRAGAKCEMLHMKEKRTRAQGGSRRHDDPPPWLDPTLSLERRRTLLDRAIKDLTPAPPPQQQGEVPDA